LERGEIPPTVGVQSINPKIKLDEWNIKIVTENIAWPSYTPVKRAGVNSFGYGGANSHVILDAADMHVPSGYMTRLPEETVTATSRSTMFLPVSATNDTALKRRLTNLSSLDLPNVNTIDLAYTLGIRRSHLPVRGYVLARPGHQEEDLTIQNLRTRLQGKTYSQLPLSFVFTGQGAQWPEMGRGLLAEFPIFRRTIQMLDSTLQLLPHPPSWTLMGTILESPETSMINHASRSQPICTAVQVGLVNLLSSCGIKPQRVVGHSSGEIAAAYAAGFVSAKQAIAIAYYRGYAVTRSSKVVVGAMMAAGLSRTEANEKISALGLGNKINVACVNSPESVTISGDVDGVQELKASLDSQGIFARLLKTDGKAYHSHHMAAIGEEYEQYLNLAAAVLGSLTPDASALSKLDATWISSVNGEIVEQEASGSSYWRANLESPVLFETVVAKLLKDYGPQHLIELGPHSALELPIKQTYTNLNISKDKVHYNAALSRGKDSINTFLNLVGDLYLHGHTISFKDVNVVGSWSIKSTTRLLPELRQGTMLLDLPKYDWEYDSQQQLWHESRTSTEWRNRKYPHHDLLGSVVHGGNGILTSWRNVLKVKNVPWMEGHKLDTTIVVPAAAYLAMAVEAMSQVKGLSNVDTEDMAFALQDIHITKALVLPQEDGLDTGVEVFTTMQPAHSSKRGDSGWYRFNISSYSLDEATTHATGLIQLSPASEIDYTTRLPEIKQDDVEPTAPRVWYKQFVEGGLNFQGAFQSLNQVHVHTKRQATSILANTELRQSGGSSVDSESKYVVHPVTIDALLQAGIIANTRGVVRALTAKVPVHVEQMVLRTPRVGQSAVSTEGMLNVKAIAEPVGFGTIRTSAELYDNEGAVLLRISKCRLVAYESGVQQQAEEERHPMLRVLWKPDITHLGPTNGIQLSSYIEQYVARAAIDAGPNGVAMARLMAVVDLLAHKNPRLRILSFLSEKDEAELASALRMATQFKRCQSLWRASSADDGVLQFQDYSSDKKPARGEVDFDLVLLGPDQFETALASLQDVVAPNGALLLAGTSREANVLEELGFERPLQSQFGGPHESILARRVEQSPDKKSSRLIKEEVLIVERNQSHSLNSAIANQMEILTGRAGRRVAFDQVTAELLQAHSNVIATVELDDPLLSNVTEDEMTRVKLLTDNCATLVWVTGGRLLQGSRPEMGIVYGLSRALMLEQPSLRFFVVDVDTEASSSPSDIDTAATNVLHVLAQAVQAPEPDFEFIHAAGMLHVSRFLPAEAINSTFREKQGAEKRTLTLAEAQPFHLDIERVGQTDSTFFRQDEAAVDVPLVAGQVEVSVKAVGLCSRVSPRYSW
jgi:acyl transferase domain-containing protein